MIRRIFATLGSKVLSACLNFFILVLLSRMLGPEGKGLCSLAISFIALFLIFINIAGGPVLVFLVPRFTIRSLLIPSYLWLVAVAIVFYVFLGLYDGLPDFLQLHVTLILLLHALLEINLNVLLGKERSGTYNLLYLLQVTLSFVTLLIQFFLLENLTVMSYIYALYAGYGITSVCSCFAVAAAGKAHTVTANNGAVRELFRLGVVNQVAMLAQFMSYRFAFYVLESNHGSSAVGVYSNAASIAEAVWLLGNSISLVLYARISNTTDREASGRLTIQLMRMNFLVTLCTVLPIALLPSAFYVDLFGDGFSGVRPAILLLLPGILLFSLTIVCSNFFSGTGRIRVNTTASLVGMVVVILLSLWLVPLYGIRGAAIASAASYIFTTVYSLVVFFREANHSLSSLFSLRFNIGAFKDFF